MGDAHRAHPGQGRPLVRAARRRVPRLLEPDGDQHRRPEVLPRQAQLARARALGAADDRPRRRHHHRVGHQGPLLRRRRRGRDVPGRADPSAAASDGRVQLAGVVQRRLRGAPPVQRLLHPLGRGQHGVDPRLDPQGGAGLPRRLGLGHQPEQAALLAGAAREGRLRLRAGVVHARRRRLGRHDQVGRKDAPRGQDGRPERRPPRHRGVHLVQAARGGEGPRAAGGRLRHEPRLARLGVDPVPERQ